MGALWLCLLPETSAFLATFWKILAPSLAMCFWTGGRREGRAMNLWGRGGGLPKQLELPFWEENAGLYTSVLLPHVWTFIFPDCRPLNQVHRRCKYIQSHRQKSWLTLPLDLVWSMLPFADLLTLWGSSFFLWTVINNVYNFEVCHFLFLPLMGADV